MPKPLDRLTLLETFVRIADTGSISAAARDLGLSQPSASRQLVALEERLKTQLIRRSTHALALTDAGSELLAQARPLIDGWDRLEERYLTGTDQIQGKLKVVAPIALGQLHLARLAWRFQLKHPQIALNWLLEDRPIRFAEVGCDCWIKVGPVPDETLVVRALGSVERLLVASNAFVAQYGLPRTPRQAERLDLVGLEPFEGGLIPLTGPKGRQLSLKPRLRMMTNNIFALKEAAVMGLGMAIMPRWFVDAELERGNLIDLLPTWRAPSLAIHVAYLPGRHPPRKVRAFLDALNTHVPKIAGINSAVAA